MTIVRAEQPYDALADEYYDARHQTSRNFDFVTASAIRSLGLTVPTGLVLDVGCGRGRVGEFLNVPADRVIQLDSSAKMLAIQPREPAKVRLLHDAEALPFADGEFALVAAFLCDPFLGLNFLSEARRVLGPGGKLVGTTPSLEWGKPLRDQLGLEASSTRFILGNGTSMEVPSALFGSDQIRDMLIRVGFPADSVGVHRHTLPENASPVSNDILAPALSLGVSPFELEILYTFVADA